METNPLYEQLKKEQLQLLLQLPTASYGDKKVIEEKIRVNVEAMLSIINNNN